MRRSACLLALLLACGAACASAADQGKGLGSGGLLSAAERVVSKLQGGIKEAAEAFASKHPNGAVAAALEARSKDGGKRRLLTGMESVQDFMSNVLGGSWKDFVPTAWSSPAFDWSHLGEFDYSSNLGDFMDHSDLKNLTSIRSVKDLHKSVEFVEGSFCTPEEFVKGEKVPAACVGPSVTIALTPKTCVLEAHTKQIVCEPAKLVLTKEPGSCTHKYKSASVWVGKECKIAGETGFSDEVVIGGGAKSIPLVQIDVGFEPSAPAPTPAPPVVCTGANFDSPSSVPALTTSLAFPAVGGSPACSGASLVLSSPQKPAGCPFDTEFIVDADGTFLVASPGCDQGKGIPYKADLAAAGADVTIKAVQIGYYAVNAPPFFLTFNRPDGTSTQVEVTGLGITTLPAGGLLLPAGASGYSVEFFSPSGQVDSFIQIKRWIVA